MSLFNQLLGDTGTSSVTPDLSYAFEDAGHEMIAFEAAEASNEVVQLMGQMSVYQSKIENNMGDADVAAALESTKDSIFTRIKDGFIKLWKKTAGLIKNLSDKLVSLAVSNEKFIAKHEAKLREANLEGYSLEGFVYTNIDDYANNVMQTYGNVQERVNAAVSELEGFAESKNDQQMKVDLDATVELTKSQLVGASSKVDDFPAELKKYFRNGATKSSKVPFNVDEAVKALKTSSEVKKNAKVMKKAIDGSFSDLLKKYKQIEKEAGKLKADGDGNYTHEIDDKKVNISSDGYSSYVAAARHLYTTTSKRQAAVNTALAEWRKALYESQGFAKRGVIGALIYKKAEKSNDK